MQGRHDGAKKTENGPFTQSCNIGSGIWLPVQRSTRLSSWVAVAAWLMHNVQRVRQLGRASRTVSTVLISTHVVIVAFVIPGTRKRIV